MDRKKQPLLEAQAISKIYTQEAGALYALKNISLAVEPGDIYGIIGLSGAGKSTLLRALSGLLKPSSGKVLFHGVDISSLTGKNLRAFRQKVGMIFQHFNLLSSRTAFGNIAYPLEIAGHPSDQRVEELLAMVGLSAKKGCYPALLSGGEKQRVAIARALANHPEILFCDEATSALDPRTTFEILDLLKEIHQKLGLTIVLITHDMEVIKRICRQVAVIEKGEIIEKGLVAEVFADPKHPTTQRFIQGSCHDIPLEFFKPASAERLLLRLKFKGKAAGKPIISQIVKKYELDANILLGWIDRLQTSTIGTLVIELTGSSVGIESALQYLAQQDIHYEVLSNGL